MWAGFGAEEGEAAIQFVDTSKGLPRGCLALIGEAEWFDSHRCSGTGYLRAPGEEAGELLGVVLV